MLIYDSVKLPILETFVMAHLQVLLFSPLRKLLANR